MPKTSRLSWKVGAVPSPRYVGNRLVKYYSEVIVSNNPCYLYYAASKEEKEECVALFKRGGRPPPGVKPEDLKCPISECNANDVEEGQMVFVGTSTGHPERNELVAWYHTSCHLHDDILGGQITKLKNNVAFMIAAQMFHLQLQTVPDLHCGKELTSFVLGVKESTLKQIDEFFPEDGDELADVSYIQTYMHLFRFRRSLFNVNCEFIGTDKDWLTLRRTVLKGTTVMMVNNPDHGLRNSGGFGNPRYLWKWDFGDTVDLEDEKEVIKRKKIEEMDGGEDEPCSDEEDEESSSKRSARRSNIRGQKPSTKRTVEDSDEDE
ncbi:hypothetical protein JCM5350_007800 [Sporobolomyces pararoseus]